MVFFLMIFICFSSISLSLLFRAYFLSCYAIDSYMARLVDRYRFNLFFVIGHHYVQMSVFEKLPVCIFDDAVILFGQLIKVRIIVEGNDKSGHVCVEMTDDIGGVMVTRSQKEFFEKSF